MHPKCIYNGVDKCYIHATKRARRNEKQKTIVATDRRLELLQQPSGLNCKSENDDESKKVICSKKGEDHKNIDGQEYKTTSSQKTDYAQQLTALGLVASYGTDDDNYDDNNDDNDENDLYELLTLVNDDDDDDDDDGVEGDGEGDGDGGITWDTTIPIIDPLNLSVHDTNKTSNNQSVGEGLFLKRGSVLKNKQRIAKFVGDEVIVPTNYKFTVEESEYAIMLTPTTVLQCREYAKAGNIIIDKKV